VLAWSRLRPVTDLRHRLLLRVEVVGQQRLSEPDLVAQQAFRAGVITVVAGGLAHDCPVLLLDARAVAFLAGPDLVKVFVFFSQ